MASFIHAFRKTMGHEGKYSDQPEDAGGETYRGISRVHNPNLVMWDYIDDFKITKTDLNGKEVFDFLDPRVQEFYRMFYWDRLLLDRVKNQAIAEEMFDTGVNMGLGRAAKYLQVALNVMNRNQRLFPDLVVDGRMGLKTLGAANDPRWSADDIHAILVWMNVQQGMHYIDYMTQSPKQETFARGWAKRVKLEKS